MARRLYQTYIHIEFIGNSGVKNHYDALDNLMKILSDNGFKVKDIHSAEDGELIRIHNFIGSDLNELNDKCKFLEIENESLEDSATKYAELYHKTLKENEQLKDDLKRCRNWINSDKNDYELTLAFIKNKGYSLKDVLEYEKELKSE